MTCEYCGKELIKRPKEKPSLFKRRRFCGLKCVGQWRRSQALKGVERFCKRCGKKLIPDMRKRTYHFRRRTVCTVYCLPKKVYIKKPKKHIHTIIEEVQRTRFPNFAIRIQSIWSS